MRRIFVLSFVLAFCVSLSWSQGSEGDGGAKIKFEKTLHDFGSFPESSPRVSCVFSFTNVGTAPLIVNQAVASCGCTVPEYTKTPIAPGGKGEIRVTYNGAGRFPGKFKKSITVRTNGSVEMTRLYITGDMVGEE